MKLSQLVKKCREKYPNSDPDVVVLDREGQFTDIDPLARYDYHSETLFGNPIEQKDFVCIESVNE